MARRTVLWVAGIVVAVWAVAMTGSAYGLWATKKIMNFTQLQRETFAQQQQLRQSLDQAQALDGEVQGLRKQMSDLLKVLNLKGSDQGADAPTLRGAQGTPTPQKLGMLQQQLERTSLDARRVQTHMAPIIDRWNHTPAIPPTAGFLSSPFGFRIRPLSPVSNSDAGVIGFHSGIDIANAEGTPIQATADGTVIQAGWMNSYGYGVVIQHTPQFTTLYAHMSKVRVEAGQKVARGDILGNIGRTGNATGPHLHYEVRINGRPVNPMPYTHLQRDWLSSLRR